MVPLPILHCDNVSYLKAFFACMGVFLKIILYRLERNLKRAMVKHQRTFNSVIFKPKRGALHVPLYCSLVPSLIMGWRHVAG